MKRTAKEEVLAKWPNAIAWQWSNCITIYSSRHDGVELGTAATYRAAWADAARRLKAPA